MNLNTHEDVEKKDDYEDIDETDDDEDVDDADDNITDRRRLHSPGGRRTSLAPGTRPWRGRCSRHHSAPRSEGSCSRGTFTTGQGTGGHPGLQQLLKKYSNTIDYKKKLC